MFSFLWLAKNQRSFMRDWPAKRKWKLKNAVPAAYAHIMNSTARRKRKRDKGQGHNGPYIHDWALAAGITSIFLFEFSRMAPQYKDYKEIETMGPFLREFKRNRKLLWTFNFSFFIPGPYSQRIRDLRDLPDQDEEEWEITSTSTYTHFLFLYNLGLIKYKKEERIENQAKD